MLKQSVWVQWLAWSSFSENPGQDCIVYLVELYGSINSEGKHICTFWLKKFCTWMHNKVRHDLKMYVISQVKTHRRSSIEEEYWRISPSVCWTWRQPRNIPLDCLPGRNKPFNIRMAWLFVNSQEWRWAACHGHKRLLEMAKNGGSFGIILLVK